MTTRWQVFDGERRTRSESIATDNPISTHCLLSPYNWQVRWNDLPLSLQEMMDLMEQKCIPLEHYSVTDAFTKPAVLIPAFCSFQAIAQLRRKGYLVRFVPPLGESGAQDPAVGPYEFDVFEPGVPLQSPYNL